MQWPLIIWIFQLQYVSVYLMIEASPDVYTLVTPCSRVSILILIRVYSSYEYTHTMFIEKMFISVHLPFRYVRSSTSFLSVSISSTWTRPHVCMFTPRLFNPNKTNTCEQVNAKHLYIYAYIQMHIKWISINNDKKKQYMYIYIYIYICIHIYIYVHVYLCIHMYVCTVT